MTQAELNFTDSRNSQTARILAELKRGRALTKWEILHELGCLNGGGRIYDLRHGKFDGVEYPIKMDKVKVKSRAGIALVASYWLEAK